MINITEQELKIVLDKLSEIPLKYSVELFGFFSGKAKEEVKDDTEKEVKAKK